MSWMVQKFAFNLINIFLDKMKQIFTDKNLEFTCGWQINKRKLFFPAKFA